MPRTRPIWMLSVLAGALAAGYGVLFTIVGDYRDEYGISESWIGVIIGSGFLAAFVAQILIAPLADRGYARRIIMLGVVANIVGLLLMGFGESLAPILTGRLISGVGIGAAVPAIRRVVILADPENLGQNLGRLFSAEVFGFAIGPAISAVLIGPFPIAAPFIVVAFATAVCVPFIYGVNVTETPEATGQRLALDLLRSRVVAGAVVLGAGVFLMIGAFDALWDLVHEDLDTPPVMANLGITFFAIPLVVFGPTGGRLAQRVGPFRVAAGGLIIGAAFMFSYGQLPTGSWIFAVSMAHAINDGLTASGSSVAIAMAVPENRQAGAQGMMGAAQALAAGLTAIVVGTLYEQSGREVAYTAAAIGMVALVVVGVALAMPFIRGRRSGVTDDVARSGTAPVTPLPTR